MADFIREIRRQQADAELTAFTLRNTDNPATTETGQAVALLFGGRGDSTGTASYSDASFAKIVAGKDSDYYGAAADWDGNLKFYTATDGTLTFAMTIDSSQIIGMGTEDPFQNVGTAAGDFTGTGLHVKGAGIARLILEGITASLFLADSNAAADDKIMGYYVSDGVARFRSIDDAAGIRVDNILAMDMGTGKIGIGMKSPDTLFHIFEGSAGTVTAIANTLLTLESDGDCYMSLLADVAAGFYWGKNGNNNVAKFFIDNMDSTADFKWEIGGTRVLEISPSKVEFNDPEADVNYEFRTTVGISVFIDGGTGFIGIGTGSPASLLDVRGDVSTVPALDADTVAVFSKTVGEGQNCSISIISAVDGQSRIYFGDTADEDPGFLKYSNGGGGFSIGVETTEYFTIDANGLIPYNATTIHAIAQNAAPTSVTAGALWLDTDAGANGTLMCYANGAWRTVQAL